MAGSAAPSRPKLKSRAPKETDTLIIGCLPTNNSGGMDLMQNCDLPPPSKLYFGSDKLVVSSMTRIFAMMGQDEGSKEGGEYVQGDEKLELLKAVRLSQTRAREAEMRAERLGKEKEWISNAFSTASLQLFAYRQFAKLLELRILKLEAELASVGRDEVEVESCSRCGKNVKERDPGGMSWKLALALCFGAGIVLGFGGLVLI